MSIRPLRNGFLAALGRGPSQDEAEKFERYLALLLRWNRVHRLTSYREPAVIVERLFVDSLYFLRWVGSPSSRLLDLGAGAGIPGLPLKIVEPELRVTLLEARRRRVSFLSAAVRELGMEGVVILEGRAEALLEVEPALRGRFDVVVTRAAGPLPAVLPLAFEFLRAGGRFIASGPPGESPLPRAPGGTSRWETIPLPGRGRTRRFLVGDKES